MVAADVAGYSRLIGRDDVGTTRKLREHRAVTDALVRYSARDLRVVMATSGAVHHVIGQEFSARLRRAHDLLADQIA